MDQFVIRPMTEDDLGWILAITNKIELGFTSMPNDPEYLKKRVATVVNSFAEHLPPQARLYMFVCENIQTGHRVGMSGIQAAAGFNTIFYNYEISTVSEMNRQMNIHFEHKVLDLVNSFQNATELVSLWIDPAWRDKKFGKPLSFARFLFMAQFPQLLNETVVAEIRGMVDEQGNSPFWEAIGRHFFGIDFTTADYLTMSTDKQFIADLMPHLPIYVDLLPKDAQQVLGKPHPTAEPAYALLESQGFRYRNYVDIFDGGPLMVAETRDIKLIAGSKLQTVIKIEDNLSVVNRALIGTTQLGMRITAGDIQETADGVILNQITANILRVNVGDQVRYAGI